MPPHVELFMSEVEAFGGAERALLALARWLGRHGVPHRILTYRDGIGLQRYAQAPLEVLTLPASGGAWSKIGALRKHLAGAEKQTRLLCSGYQPALHSSLAGARGFHCLMHDTPSLFGDAEQRTVLHRCRLRLSNRVIGHGLRSGGVTVVNSDYLKAECARDFGVNATVARMGGMPPADGWHVRPFRGTLRLLSVCRMEANKRIDWILHALAALEEEAPFLSARADWRLTLAGKGSQIAALQALAQRLRIAHRVEFTGFVPDERLQELLSSAHLFLMPAVQGFGIPAVEALHGGLPVLLHRQSGVSDMLLHTPWATVFGGDAASMVPALRSAIAGVMAGSHIGHAPPRLPTEDEWSAAVARLCGWI